MRLAETNRPVTENRSVGRARTILVVDDNELVLKSTQTALEAAGHLVLTRTRPEGTIAAILQGRPDLVLLDVNMPRINGKMVASVVNAAPVRKTILLLHSNLSTESLNLKVLQTGAQGYIQKTRNMLEFMSQVDSWLKKTGSTATFPPAFVAPTVLRSVPREVPASSERWPVAERLTSASAPPATAASGALRLSIPTALFVDQDRATLLDYEHDLKHESILAELTQSSERALERILSSTPPDVVVCETLMPKITGLQLFERAIRHHATWRQRFVFVTAGTESGVTDYLRSWDARVLPKPVEMERLVRAVRYAALAARIFREGRVGKI